MRQLSLNEMGHELNSMDSTLQCVDAGEEWGHFMVPPRENNFTTWLSYGAKS